jgi:hypothetical protein
MRPPGDLMRRLILAAAGVCAAISPTPAERGAAVRIHVAVEDQSGKPVHRLAAGMFSLTVDGASRPIESVVPSDQPLSVTVLVDDSLSMQPFASRLQKAAKEFAAGLDAADRLRVEKFGTAPGGSAVWDAIHRSVELVADQSGRRAILVLTDGRASGNLHSLEEVAERSVDRAVSLSAVVPDPPRGIRQDAKTMAVVTPAANLDRLAQYTGGVLLGGYAVTDQPLKQLRGLAARLRAGYTVTFAMPDADSRRHRLDVRVATPGLRVRAPMAFRVSGRME